MVNNDNQCKELVLKKPQYVHTINITFYMSVGVISLLFRGDELSLYSNLTERNFYKLNKKKNKFSFVNTTCVL